MNPSHAAQPNSRGNLFQWFFRSEVSGGLVLLACTVMALAMANSGLADGYFDLLHTKVGISWGDAAFKLSVQHWVNDALMAVFFFVVGLEIKREIAVGELSSLKKAILPVSAAAGGMLLPAGLFLAFNAGGPGADGWGIPMATDIAFALGVLALLGPRVPLGLKVFLTALAIADDIGAVLVIALFYTASISWTALLAAGVFLALLVAAGSLRVRRPSVYILLALGVWVAVFLSGVHATVAGILVALVVPIRAQRDPAAFLELSRRKLAELEATRLTRDSMVKDSGQLHVIEALHEAAGDMRPPGISLEHNLHPIQAFLILPLFALCNAGVRLDASLTDALLSPVSLGVIVGLFVGKQIGVPLFAWLAIRLGWADMPDGVGWRKIYGAGCLAGIGFTMSLFIAELGLGDAVLVDQAKVGILTASLLSALIGAAVLMGTPSRSGPES